MPRYAKKTYKKRVYRKRKTLKKSNIFSRKSAKSQAKQIYALNKKINHIQKLTKPEIQTFYLSEESGLLNQSFAVPYDNHDYRGHITHFRLFKNLLDGNQAAQLPAPFKFSGNMFRIQNKIKLWVKISAGKAAVQTAKLIYRIVVMRMNGPGDQNSQSPLFNVREYEASIRDIKTVIYGPLMPNITQQGKIVYNKVGSFDNTNKEPMIYIPIYLYGGIMRKNPIGTTHYYSTVLKNDYMIGIAYGWTSKYIDGEVSGVYHVTNDINVGIGCKFAYVDDSDTLPNPENSRQIITKETLLQMKAESENKIKDTEEI